jgi:hypothetical protein
MEPTVPLEATATVTASVTTPLPTVGFDVFSLILQLFGGNETTASFFSSNGVVDFLGSLWSIYVFIALLLSLIMLGLYTYASIWRWFYFNELDRGIREAEQLYDAQFRGIAKNSRMDDIQQHSLSENPNDWKLAIIEADIILDGLLKERGYAGGTLGERLRSVAPHQLSSLQDAWEAHKVRNMIAHEGPDFILTKRMVEETIARYRRVFAEFGIL